MARIIDIEGKKKKLNEAFSEEEREKLRGFASKNETDEGEQKEKKKSQADILVELAAEAFLFHDETYEPYAAIPVQSHREIWPVNSKFFKRWLAGQAWAKLKKTLASETIKSALNVIEGQAVFKGPEYKLHNRIAFHDGAIWYDLSDPAWRAVRITPEGWQVINNPPILFRRFTHQAAQVTPLKYQDPAATLSAFVKNFVNLKDGQEIIFLTYLISCFIPDIPHPIPVLYGEKGAAKTTTFKLIKRIVDPSAVEALTFPKDVNELIQKLSHHYWAGFDNVSNLPEWISDTLCRAVTGEGFSKRQLYSDDEDVIYTFKRCIGLNGINVVATREDLLDRAILLGLERIPKEKRREERAVLSEFEQERPYILGATLDILAKSMAIYPTVKLTALYRMADFTRWGYAIAEALGGQGEEFLKQYGQNIQNQNEEAIAANPVAAAVMAFMSRYDEGFCWEGRASELLQELCAVAEEEKIDTHSRIWPRSSNSLTRKLNQIKSNLLEAGIEYSYQGHTREGTIIILRSIENTVTTVTTSQMASILDLNGDGIGDDIVTRNQISSQVSSQAEVLSDAGCDDSDDGDDISETLYKDELVPF